MSVLIPEINILNNKKYNHYKVKQNKFFGFPITSKLKKIIYDITYNQIEEQTPNYIINGCLNVDYCKWILITWATIPLLFVTLITLGFTTGISIIDIVGFLLFIFCIILTIYFTYKNKHPKDYSRQYTPKEEYLELNNIINFKFYKLNNILEETNKFYINSYV